MNRVLNWLRRGRAGDREAVPVERKSGYPLIAFQGLGEASWSPTGSGALVNEGFVRNPVVYRCVRMIGEAAAVGGIDAADLNFPDHFEAHKPAELASILAHHGLALNGLAMRYYSEPGFRSGAFTNPDRGLRRAAIDLTKRGIDACAAMGGSQMTLWLGQD